VCVLVYVRTHTQTARVLDVSPGVGRTSGEPEEPRSTKAHYTCRPYRCTQYICLYIFWAAGFDATQICWVKPLRSQFDTQAQYG